MNNVSLVGRWVADLELRYTQSGTAVAQGRLAVNRIFKKEGQPDADFIGIVLWGKQAENAAQYTGKGSLVAITGRIQTRSYENNAGQKVYVTEIVVENIQFLSSPKNNGNNGQQQSNQQQQSQYADPFSQNGGYIDISDDDLPF